MNARISTSLDMTKADISAATIFMPKSPWKVDGLSYKILSTQ